MIRTNFHRFHYITADNEVGKYKKNCGINWILILILSIILGLFRPGGLLKCHNFKTFYHIALKSHTVGQNYNKCTRGWFNTVNTHRFMWRGIMCISIVSYIDIAITNINYLFSLAYGCAVISYQTPSSLVYLTNYYIYLPNVCRLLIMILLMTSAWHWMLRKTTHDNNCLGKPHIIILILIMPIAALCNSDYGVKYAVLTVINDWCVPLHISKPGRNI